MNSQHRAMLSLAVFLAIAGPATEGRSEMIGRTVLVVERVTGTIGPTVRQLVLRSDVNRSELVETAEGSATQLAFLDGTAVSLGPKAQLLLDELVYDPRPSRAKLSISFVEGAFRFVTGAFSKDAYTINTPTATIGVRGTSFGCVVNGARKPGSTVSSNPITACEVTDGVIIVTNKITGETSIVGPGQTITVAGDLSGSSLPGGSGDQGFVLLAELRELDSLLRDARFAGLGGPGGSLVNLPNDGRPSYGSNASSAAGSVPNGARGLIDTTPVVSPNGLR